MVATIAGTDYSAAANPLLKGRHKPDFSHPFSLSGDDRTVLSMRGMTGAEQDEVAAIYSQARGAVQGGTAKTFLSSLDSHSLALLQEAASLAEPVKPAGLTEEGAQNLLLSPTEGVDLNGDGLVQTGAAMSMVFPPVDASPGLRAAWEKTIAGMDAGDAMTMALMVSGPALSVDGTQTRMTDFSEGFDWQQHMDALLNSNEMSKSRNTQDQYETTKRNLLAFLDALRSEGLA